MADAKDPAIKLFGKTIPFPDASEEEGEEEEASKDCKKEDEEEEEETVPEEQSKVLKKPDKILPCPRCNSMETKFCYYNNYNVNQPRHFCKNCQRYWTAGGTMRNVPVGAGRRKNKTHFRQIAVPETLSRPETPKPNGTVLTFGSDVPLHESMASVLTLRPEPETEVGSSQENPAVSQNVPFLPRVPWSYPMVPPGFYPVPVFPCWGYTLPSPFPLPWIPSPTSGPSSPTLGKHSRDENTQKTSDDKRENGSEKCLWIPKTLRIDDPEEAAKSSIWTTLGIRPDKPDLIGGRAIFKTFKSKGDENTRIAETSPVLQANPAALSRSVNFHESS